MIGVGLLFIGCASRPTEFVAWNPASDRCQVFRDGKFAPPFLPNERCAGLPRPEEIPE